MYKDFWTQTPLGLVGFSDIPLRDVPDDEKYYGFFPAKHVATYLQQYCDGHVYDGRSLSSRIRVEMPVRKVFKGDDRWTVIAGHASQLQCSTPHIVDASGLTSIPNWPTLPGRAQYKGTIIHQRDFAQFETTLSSDTPRTIVVIGGAKSAADVGASVDGYNRVLCVRRLLTISPVCISICLC